MENELIGLRDRLQLERQQLAERLNEIDIKLTSINTVFDLLKEQHTQSDKAQLPLINIDQISDRFAGFTFRKSVKLLLKDNPEKTRGPKEISEDLLKEGFKTTSKNFRNVSRTMLKLMREDKEITAIKTNRGYLYSHKKEGSVPHMAETEPNSDNGGLPELVKGTDL